MEITQPFMVNHYNQIMEGVDRMDHNVDKYRISKKWWWLLTAFCVVVSIQQAWHLYRATPAAETNHWIFLLSGVSSPGSTLPVPHEYLRLVAKEDLS